MNINLDELIYKKDGYDHTNALEVVNFEIEEEEIAFNKAVFDMLLDQEIRFIFDDATVDNSTAFIAFKYKNKLMLEYIFAEDGWFEIDVEGVSWIYPKYSFVSKADKVIFYNKLNQYIKDEELKLNINFITYKDPKKVLEQSESDQKQLNPFQTKAVTNLAMMARYGVIMMALLGGLMGMTFSGSADGFIWVLGSISLLYGLYVLCGVIYKFRHIYCMFQNLENETMTPNEVYWNSFKKSLLYGYPSIFIILGLGLITYQIITLI